LRPRNPGSIGTLTRCACAPRLSSIPSGSTADFWLDE
jgi:hypothetical protein